jgi:hypothetical protein
VAPGSLAVERMGVQAEALQPECGIRRHERIPARAAGLRPIHRIAVGDTHVVVYLTNGDATTAYGILVRQERRIAPGVLRVAEIASVCRATDADVQVLDRRHIRLTIEGHRPRTTGLPLGAAASQR